MEGIVWFHDQGFWGSDLIPSHRVEVPWDFFLSKMLTSSFLFLCCSSCTGRMSLLILGSQLGDSTVLINICYHLNTILRHLIRALKCALFVNYLKSSSSTGKRGDQIKPSKLPIVKPINSIPSIVSVLIDLLSYGVIF